MSEARLVAILQEALVKSEELWDEGKSPAYALGYLQGIIKGIIEQSQK